MSCKSWFLLLAVVSMTIADASGEPVTLRLYPALTAYIDNPAGDDFEVTIDLRDINVYAVGPREVLIKIYRPDGSLAVREVVPDDGVAGGVFMERVAGWDHRLQYMATLRADGHVPMIRESAFSDPARLATLAKRSFRYRIDGGPGIYRVLLAGAIDHFATVGVEPELKYGVAGHHNWVYGSGEQYRKSYIYVPRDTTGLHFGIMEADEPLSRRFTLTAPDGEVLFDGQARGSFRLVSGKDRPDLSDGLATAGYAGKLLKLTVSPGANDFAVMLDLKQPFTGVFKDYIGMGSRALLAPDPESAMALRGGTIEVDGEVFWHPFQVRFHRWLQTHALDASDAERALHADLSRLADRFRLIGVGDVRGAGTYNNLAYSFGYAGCAIWRLAWQLMQRDDVPESAKAIIREGLILGGDRYSFVAEAEKTNGNSFTQINVALWYAHQATGDALLKSRFETFWQRWTTEGWGPGTGLSRSGDSQEIFAHAWHYMSYLMNNWMVGGLPIYVEDGKGIIGDAVDDRRWLEVVDRVRDLFSYIYCREATGKGYRHMVVASPWSSRSQHHPLRLEENWEIDGRTWKGEPGPDLTVSVNGGNEWFAARRPNYYIVTYHGRMTPAYTSKTMAGQLGFSGGMICHLTVPGKGPVLSGNLNGWYGVGMHPSQWRSFRIHSIVGETWDGRPLISAIGEHDNARLEGNVVSSSGEVREAHVRVARQYTFNADSIDCEVALADSDYKEVLSIWSQPRKWSEVRLAYEMIPYGVDNVPNERPKCTVTLAAADGSSLGSLEAELKLAQVVQVDRGGYGVRIELPRPLPVKRGDNRTVMIQLTDHEVPAEDIRLAYRLVPYR